MSEPIVFIATVYKVQSLASDNGIRLILDLPEDAVLEMAQLATCQRFGQALSVMCTPVNQVLSGKGKKGNGKLRNLEAGEKRQSEWQTAKE